ncbi:GTP-binding protein [Platanthera guangdongensis]|uniref:GTP-binding protein n=1 Tax=Platanthera guangdongensis TaxID=2320717 RepID=A0ABR2LDF8_9ASPA
MELGLATLSSSTSLTGTVLSLSPYPPTRFLARETFRSHPSPRNQFQAVAASRSRAKLPSVEGRNMTTLSETRRPIENEEDEEEAEWSVDEQGERLSSDSSASFLSLNSKPDRSLALLDDYELEELHSDHFTSCWGLDQWLYLAMDDRYVAVLGKPNVGKSTLSNQMIGQKLFIVTDKPQTTRHRILGICSDIDYQKMHKLDSLMMKNVRTAAINADCILLVVDASKVPKKLDEVLEEGVGAPKDKVPILCVLNKKDLLKPREVAQRIEWYEKFTEADEVIPVSAKYGHGVDDVKDWILSKLPLGPAYYPKRPHEVSEKAQMLLEKSLMLEMSPRWRSRTPKRSRALGRGRRLEKEQMRRRNSQMLSKRQLTWGDSNKKDNSPLGE